MPNATRSSSAGQESDQVTWPDPREFVPRRLVAQSASVLEELRAVAPVLARACQFQRETELFCGYLIDDRGYSIDEYAEQLALLEVETGLTDVDYVLGSFFLWIKEAYEGSTPDGAKRAVARNLAELEALEEGWKPTV